MADDSTDPGIYDLYGGNPDPGTGSYSIGGGDWQPVSGYGSSSYSYAPQPALTAAEGGGGWSPGQLTGEENAFLSSTPSFASATGGGAGGGRGGFGGQPSGGPTPYSSRSLASAKPTVPMPDIGAPERKLYDLYSGNLSNLGNLTGTDAYKFLFDQGMQAFNRTAAANRMQFATTTGDQAQRFGQGLALNYAQRLMPLYGAGAEAELGRFATPASLALQRYRLGQGDVTNTADVTRLNNATLGEQGQEAAAADLLPYYKSFLTGGGTGMPTPSSGAFSVNYGGGYGGGSSNPYPSFGGVSYNPGPSAPASPPPPRLSDSLGQPDFSAGYY